MACKLVITEERYSFFIQWEEDDDLGGYLCQSKTDGMGDPPKDRDEWEHWVASRAVRSAPGYKQGSFGAYWESEKEARAALRIAKEALKQDRPMPEWATTALAAGWKPPKGWKA
jgi:hypothetical protein